MSIPGAHSLSFRDPSTLYVSTVIGQKTPSQGGVVECSMDVHTKPFFTSNCSYYSVATGPEGAVAVRNAICDKNDLEIYSQKGHKVVEWQLPAGKHKGMVIDAECNLYVCDASSHCIRVYDLTGELKRVIKNKEIRKPQYIALTLTGLVVTCMGDEPSLVSLSLDGEVLWSYDEFDWVAGVAVDGNNDIYVCDVVEKKVIMLANEGEVSFDLVDGSMLQNHQPFSVAVCGNKLAVQLLECDVVKLFTLTS